MLPHAYPVMAGNDHSNPPRSAVPWWQHYRFEDPSTVENLVETGYLAADELSDVATGDERWPAQ